MKETTSTMDEARRIARMGFPPGSLVAADLQSAGRGRLPERSWESRPGSNLLFTLVLAPEEAGKPGLPLRAGLALCRTADILAVRMGLPLRSPAALKWPNDLLFGAKKAAGVLCEAGPEGVFVGVGLNCNQKGFPLPLEGKATSLALEFGREVDRWLALEIFLSTFRLLLSEEDWRQGVNERLWMRGKTVGFLVGLPGACDLVVGRLEGVDDMGCLVIDVPGGDGPRAYPAGEIVVDAPARQESRGPS
ncbi:MAG TPA: biotin--[acetyl-CoA-carboxylase] ligase [Rectinemataceae bacterium]|nr:biotin--[acetyl-CoA-carboxylase] ligase [Rectinemataceae bacterium]